MCSDWNWWRNVDSHFFLKIIMTNANPIHNVSQLIAASSSKMKTRYRYSFSILDVLYNFLWPFKMLACCKVGFKGIYSRYRYASRHLIVSQVYSANHIYADSSRRAKRSTSRSSTQLSLPTTRENSRWCLECWWAAGRRCSRFTRSRMWSNLSRSQRAVQLKTLSIRLCQKCLQVQRRSKDTF